MRSSRLIIGLLACGLLPHAASAQAAGEIMPEPAGKMEAAAAPISSRRIRARVARTLPGQRADYEAMVAAHARANDVPETLVHRVIVRESKYQPHLIGRGGTIGLMQIKLGTARSLGYSGTAEGLRDPETNLTYAVKYLAGAWRIASGDANRAVSYYARGYYYAAKRQGRALQVVSATRLKNRKNALQTSPRFDELTEANATATVKP